ncbi:MAG: hypothetical protein GQ475_04235 [Methylococcaceae bacterium]|nr:hypothetical protein [Methylococcaceae bacterium]
MTKLSPPDSANIWHRERLFILLDRMIKSALIWIHGPTGCGKTSLVVSYLRKRNYKILWYRLDENDNNLSGFFRNLATAATLITPDHISRLPFLQFTSDNPKPIEFGQLFFRQLWHQLPANTVLVFDNAETLPQYAMFYQYLNLIIDEVPHGSQVMVLSHDEPCESLTKQRLIGTMNTLMPNELCANNFEASEILHACHLDSTSTENIQHWNQLAQGWVAGLILIAQHYQNKVTENFELPSSSKQLIFNFFSSQYFDQLNRGTQKILISCSLLPRLSDELAIQLTDNCKAASVLNELAHKNYFITRIASDQNYYQFHSLYQKFLREQFHKIFNKRECRTQKKHAADLLWDAGDCESAISIYRELEDWSTLCKALNQCAQSLICLGHQQIIIDLNKGVSNTTLNSYPWLLYWHANALGKNRPKLADLMLRQVFEIFKTSDNRQGLCAAWSCRVLMQLILSGNLILSEEWFWKVDNLINKPPIFDSESMQLQFTVAVFFASASSPKFSRINALWGEKLRYCIHNHSDICQKVDVSRFFLLHSWQTGRFEKTAWILRYIGPYIINEPLPEIVKLEWLSIANTIDIYRGTPEKVILNNIEDSLKIAEQLDIKNQIFVFHAQKLLLKLCSNDQSDRKLLLNNLTVAALPELPYHQALCEIFLSWIALEDNQLDEASRLIINASRQCPQNDSSLNSIYGYQHAQTRIHLARSEWQQALRQSAQIRHLGNKRKDKLTLVYALLSLAQLAANKGRMVRCRKLLAEAFVTARTHDLYRFPFFTTKVLAQLCQYSFEMQIETDYIKKLIEVNKLTAPIEATNTEPWPWVVKLHSFGRLQITINNEPLTFTKKSPQKPLMLLKAIIALGEYNISQNSLEDLLWSDEEGDAAHNALTTALNRLRKLIGKDSLLVSDGLLSLNAHQCWSDQGEFNRIYQLAEQYRRKENWLCFEKSAKKIIALYTGSFLQSDNHIYWTQRLRIKQRSRFLNITSVLGERLEMQKEFRQALDCYLKGLEHESQAECLCQGAIRCYIALGQRAEALTIFNQSRSAIREFDENKLPR